MSVVGFSRSLLRGSPLFGLGRQMLYGVRRGVGVTMGVARPVQVARYLAERGERPRGLHIGCGTIVMPGWLNTDAFPHRLGVVGMDATAPSLPFDDATFDYAYSEHMIEHIPFDKALRLLAELRRALRPGGVLRLATPDLRRVVSLLDDPDDDDARHFRDHVIRDAWPKAPIATACMAVNHSVRAWGHAFIYDEETLSAALTSAGFAKVARRPLGHSDHPFLSGLEQRGIRQGDEALNRFETMVLEAETPKDKEA